MSEIDLRDIRLNGFDFKARSAFASKISEDREL